MKRYFLYHLIISFIVLICLFTLPLFLFYDFKFNTQLNELKTREVHTLKLQEIAVEQTLKDVIANVLLLKEHVTNNGGSVVNYQNSESEIKKLANDFEAFSIGRHQIYDQLRLLDKNGNEIIRINFSKDNVRLVGKDSLQNKKHRYYFKELSKLSDDEIYMSPFDLNMEYGVIEQPIKPVLRIGTPIIDTLGNFSGAILINYLGKNILSSINDIKTSESNMILNLDGSWIQNDFNPLLEWNFMYDSLKNQRFQDSHKQAWAKIHDQEEGQFRNDSGLFTFQTIYPVRDSSFQYIPGENQRASVNILKDRLNSWKLVSYLDKSQLKAQITPLKNERNIIFLFVLFISAGLAYLFTRIRIKELIAENNLKALNNNLEYEVKQQTIDMQKAKQKAEENDRLKTAFLNNVSHEIRTPLNAVLGFANLIELNDYDKTKIKKFAGIIVKRGNDLLQIVNDILDISKIDSGQLTIQKKNIFLYHELNELIEFYQQQKQGNNKGHIELRLHCQCVSEKEQIITDIDKLRQILMNLLNNAFKFTERGSIELRCRKHENNMLLFSVSDTGIGIPEDQHKAVFDRFVKAENKMNNLSDGTGLGLSIVKELVILLGGDIWVESVPGKGSVFYFTLPYKEAFKKRKSIDFTEDTENKSLEILVVEDDLINVEYIKEIFIDTKHKITIALNGNQALQIVNGKSFDIILMDIRLPDINGVEVTRQIRKLNKDVKIIAQTAYASMKNKKDLLRSGFNGYIAKPLQMDKLIDLIKN